MKNCLDLLVEAHFVINVSPAFIWPHDPPPIPQEFLSFLTLFNLTLPAIRTQYVFL